MSKIILSGLFIFFTCTATAQLFTTVQWQGFESLPEGDTIYYQANNALNWKDFKGSPQKNSVAIAITASGFGYTVAMKSRGNKATLVISVFCFFLKNNSWVKQNMKSDYALLHEQHHFDITFIAASSFMKKLKAAAFTLNNYNSLLKKLHDESYAELEKMQNDYDGQTKNGQLSDVQSEWNMKLSRQLSALVTN